MPRVPRNIMAGVIYHVLSRGNDRKKIFEDPTEYQEFLGLLQESQERFPVDLLAYCLMPNHFHLVLQPKVAANLSRNMHWLLTTHSRRYQFRREGCGHVWQGRFKSVPVQSSKQLVTLMRYVEGNPVRAGLVNSCATWRWSSLSERLGWDKTKMLSKPAELLPTNWVEFVDTPLFDKELKDIRRGAMKFGDCPQIGGHNST